MIVKPLEFKWVVSDSRVSFSVSEPYKHRLCCFLNDFCVKNKRTPNLGEWLSFYRKNNVSKEVIQKKIKLFNKQKKDEPKLKIAFDKLYSKEGTAPTGKAKKVVKKRT